jgi:hypothetical protein
MAGENDQAIPLAQNDATTTVAATQPEVTDIDERDLQAALQEEEAEKASATGAQTVEGTPAVPAVPKPQEQNPSPHGEVVMIPKGRFDEVNAAKSKAENEAAYWRGQAEARAAQTAPAPGAAAAPQPQQTPEQKLLEIRTEKNALAKKFDDGEITMSDFEAQRDALDDRVQAIREEARPKPVAAAPANQDGGELYLETLTAQLEDSHPWVKVFDAVGTPSDWGYLKDRAISNLTARGVDPRNGNLGRYDLRKEIAALTDELGPALLTAAATKAGIALPGQSPKPAAAAPAQQTPPVLSPEAKARQAALIKAQGAPPNLNAMTGAAGESGIVTEAQLEGMTEDEIGALPASVQNKLLGISA